MGTIDIDYGSLGIGLLLMLIPVYFLWHFKTGLLKPVLIGTVRMIIQLFLIGAYLRFLFEWNNPFINFLWVIIMVGVAAETALTRTRLKRGILMIPISIAFFVTVVLVGLYFLGFVLKLDNIFSAQYFIPVYFLWHFKTGLLKPVLIGTVRMIIQLFLIGAYLRFLFEWNNPFINFLWVIIMVGVAAETALTRTRLKRGILMIPISIAFFVTVVLVGLYFLGFVLKLDNIFSAQYFIPVFGIIMGNMLGVNVIGLNTYYAGLRREQQLYYFLLGNGATRNEAIAPFVRQALIKAFSPGIANMAVTGLVALPGTMIGQILGGSSPHVAIKYQIMIVVITVVASMLSLMMTIFLASRKSFDSYGRLLRVHKDTKRK